MFKQWVIFKALIIEILLVVMLPPVNLQTHIDLEGFKALFSKVGDFLKKSWAWVIVNHEFLSNFIVEVGDVLKNRLDLNNEPWIRMCPDGFGVTLDTSFEQN